ncbi:NAD(P)-binding protein [Pseudovirgaria hyperparasitica]|uniref:NAD(P)-binding protein n=1 Tax=Pseudovirgaria hyperparasitica TaxID=470096 RepID=A0A6A6W5F9_9PEZI|nr:NAD(P)-binding protein [Pseudovirgaria hyperparasitica]KAF2757409.1 NAD(P)-binding protein [Pseudovirgaria hyperparasitica]
MCSESNTGLLSQAFPPNPRFTEKELPDQTGKIVIVTGAASGVGRELAKILYSANATVYVGARSLARVNEGIKSIRAEMGESKGRLMPLVLDLADLKTIRPAVEDFLSKETQLDVLVHNAGVMMPPVGSKTAGGHDLEMGTNVLGPFLLTRLLEPILKQTASLKNKLDSEKRPVRVVWVVSVLDSGTPKGGVEFDEVTKAPKTFKKPMENYMSSKAGGSFLAVEFARRWHEAGILSVSCNPGLMKTELQRHQPALVSKLMGIVFKPAVFGAYTELFCGFSPDVTSPENGGYYIPWGRKSELPAHLKKSLQATEDGGHGLGSKLYGWCETETMSFKA